jgi:hypothetical protein
MAGPAAAQGIAGSSTAPAGVRSAVPPGAQADRIEARAAEVPAPADKADRMIGPAAAGVPASAAPVPEAQGWAAAVSRPWGPSAARRPGTDLSGYAPAASSRRSTAGTGSSSAAAAEDRAADTAEVPAGRTDKVADMIADIAAVRTRELAPAASGPAVSVHPEGPVLPLAPRSGAAKLPPGAPAPEVSLAAAVRMAGTATVAQRKAPPVTEH